MCFHANGRALAELVSLQISPVTCLKHYWGWQKEVCSSSSPPAPSDEGEAQCCVQPHLWPEPGRRQWDGVHLKWMSSSVSQCGRTNLSMFALGCSSSELLWLLFRGAESAEALILSCACWGTLHQRGELSRGSTVSVGSVWSARCFSCAGGEEMEKEGKTGPLQMLYKWNVNQNKNTQRSWAQTWI